MTLHLFNPNSKEYKKIEQIYQNNTCMICNLPMKMHSMYFFSFDKEKAKMEKCMKHIALDVIIVFPFMIQILY